MSGGNEPKRAIREGLLELMLNADADRISASELAHSANVIEELFAVAPVTYTISDAVKSGDIYAATHGAWLCAMEL